MTVIAHTLVPIVYLVNLMIAPEKVLTTCPIRTKVTTRNRSYRRSLMMIDLPFLAAVIALIFGILILIVPRVLNFLVAIYLIIIGILGILGAFPTSRPA